MNTLGYVARQFQRPKRIRSPSSSPTLSAIGPAPVVVEQILLVRVVLLLWDRLQLAWSSLLALRSTQERTPPSRPAPARVPKTLVLDLDETLIHSTSRPMQPTGGFFGFGHTTNPGQMVEVVLGGQTMLYHVYKRPFVDFFLRTVSGWYTLVIFTASVQEYADPVIDWLDAGRGILSHRFFRDVSLMLLSYPSTHLRSLVRNCRTVYTPRTFPSSIRTSPAYASSTTLRSAIALIKVRCVPCRLRRRC